MNNATFENKIDVLDVLMIDTAEVDNLSSLTSPYLLNYIKNGQYEDVKNIILSIDFEASANRVINVELQKVKYGGYGLVCLACCFASLGGLPKTEVRKLNQAYLLNEPNFQTAKDVMVYCARICFTLAKKVYESKFAQIQTPIVFHAADYIHKHIKEKILNKNVAKQSNCSVQYLNKLFKEEVGLTVSQYIIKEKIEYSKSLIASGKVETADLYKELSFCSQSHFTQTFKKQLGITPTQYKRKLIHENRVK